MTFLTLEAISKSYGDTDAVRNVGLNIPARSRAAIVGPSGSGKTTLLRIIAGFEAPDSGQVTLGEQRLLDGDTAVPAHRRSIGYVAQEGSLFPHLSVGANVGFGIKRQDPRRAERIDRLLVQVGLDPAVRDRRPYELSGGQQQRVALARALARQPQLMLLDEPFSALDAGLREATRDMVGHVLRSAGITAILVTHDQAEALSFADYLAVMRDGQVVQAGAPQSLYRAPTDPLTAKFLGEAIILEADIANGLARTDLGMLGVGAGAADGRGTVMLRPEQISVAPLNGSGALADTVGGTIVNRSFRGAAWRLVIQPVSSSDGRAFGSAITTDMSGDTVPSIGDPVRLRVTGVAHVFDGKS